MLALPLEVETALLILYNLHKAPNHHSNSMEISEAIGLSQSLTIKVLQRLKKKSYVSSIRGRGDSSGGYELKCDLKLVTLNSVINSFTTQSEIYSRRLTRSNIPHPVRLILNQTERLMCDNLTKYSLYELFTEGENHERF